MGEKKEKIQVCDISVPFVTNFFKGSKKIQNIIHVNWSIVRNDPVIGHELPLKPKIIFRRAPNLRDIITSSYIRIEEKKSATI